MASAASVMTAPSTQPPETDPAKLPSPSTTRWLPARRGADPQVDTTVARTTLRPSRSHVSAALSGSWLLLSACICRFASADFPRYRAIIGAERAPGPNQRDG